MGTLYLVATPIGNLKDITLRALEVLSNVDLILVEDTRRAKKFLSHYKIQGPIESFFEHNEERKSGEIISQLKTGRKIALISDAGTPLLSDPGYKLVRGCLQENIRVISIPGASSILAALSASGLPTDTFLFVGFLPKKPSKLSEIMEFLEVIWKKRATTIVFFESPYRLNKTLSLLAEKFPDRDVVIAREITKAHEEFISGKAKEMLGKPITAKGEITILLH